MLKDTRNICLDICDYDNKVICNLYDNTADISGQATDVFVRTERNGWKELSFSLPYTCFGDEGEEINYRLQYLIADYRIRIQTDKETDWYIISEPKVKHNYKAKTIDVVAGHICQLLKTKNLNLEFSDEEGNNTGTAEELLQMILDGTGWSVGYVAPFLEDDKETIKVRSIVASTKTGAFMLITNLCEKFDAKPIYHGDGRIVDIVPMNPFSEVKGSEIPKEVLEGESVLELHYGYNVQDMERTLNTENLVTRLYAYGAYGDTTNKMCSLQTVEHNEYIFTMSENLNETEYEFSDKDSHSYYFTAGNIHSGDRLIWSDMDQASRSYVWNDTQRVIYKVHEEPEKDAWTVISGEIQAERNRFDYLMDFDYYTKVGLLTDEMLLEIAKFQRDMPALIDESTEASTNFLNSRTDLSRAAESNTGFLRLDVKNYTSDPEDGSLVLNLNKINYSDGVIYRSDFNEARRNYFSWYCAESLKENGDPLYDIGSVVYIIHDTNPLTWEKVYVKKIDGEVKTMDYSVRDAKDPDTISLWIMADKVPLLSNSDRIYLFSTNSISGRMGTRESEIESLAQTLQTATKIVTEEHPTYFVWDDDPAPDLEDEAELASTGYGWYYRAFSNGGTGELYFCYGVSGEVAWKRVYVSETAPNVVNGAYFFNLKTKRLYHGESSSWVDIAESPILVPTRMHPSGEYYTAPTTESKRLSQSFSKVAYYTSRYDMLYKGLYDKYSYTVTSDDGLKPGNYAFKSDYGFYWVFSTDMTIPKGNDIWLDTVGYHVYQTEDIASIVKPEAKPYEAIDFPVQNELADTTILEGSIVKETGSEGNSDDKHRTNHMTFYANVTYRYALPQNSYVVFYDQNRRYLGYQDLNTSGTFTTGPRVKYARFVFATLPTNAQYVRVNNYLDQMFLKEKQYTILHPLTTSGDKSGMLKLVDDFASIADTCYLTYLKAHQDAQQTVKENDDALKNILGDMYREGYWQKNEYVEGDEGKLYKDTYDNLDKIAKPEATYDITFLDLYKSNRNMGFSVDEELEDVEWPDIEITDAAHLIDETIDVNCWAFIDTIDKCYDQPWKTRITINTDLSTIGQHSFTDVLSRIAEVANGLSGRQSIYDRAAAISGTGKFTSDQLEGTINTNNNTLRGGSSNWYTDNKGNIIFESSDGQSAMMLTGYGWAVANSKDSTGSWQFRYTATGDGMSADFLAAGEISAQLLTAGSITTDKLNASVGQELEIGSNKSLLLYATVDGYRPSGSLETQIDNGDGTYSPVKEGDSYIRIAAQQGAAPAYIDIMTGGVMNLEGSTMNLKATSTMNLESGDLNVEADGRINIQAGGTINLETDSDLFMSGATASLTSGSTLRLDSQSNMYITSGGNMYIESGGSLDIQTGSTFTVDSPNFVIDSNGDVMLTGTIYAYAGNIAGFDIVGTYDTNEKKWKNQYLRTNNTTMDTATAGIYLGYNGMNLGGQLKYNTSNNYLTAKVKKMTVGYYSSGSAALIDLDATSANAGTISIGASSTVNIQADSTVNITAGKQVTVTSSGKVVIGNGLRPFTISANNTEAYIYNGLASMDSTEKTGIYLGTNGIRLGAAGVFSVDTSGNITATSADIMGEIKANTGRIGGSIIDNQLTGGWHIDSNMIYADNKTVVLNSAPVPAGETATHRFYAGNVDAEEADFYVMSDGTMKASKGSIAGWGITADTIESPDKKTGIYVGVKTGAEHDAEAAFWAGNTTPSNANFYVTHGGTLKANNANLNSANVYGNIYAESGNIGATITYKADGTVDKVTGGWSITNNTLSNNSGKTGMAYITGDSSIAFWAGNATPSSANFRVTNGGTLTAVNGVFSNASVDGTIEAVSGRIGPVWDDKNKVWTGGWNIKNNEMYSGSGSSYVGLSSNTSGEYSIWAGAETASEAPFSIKRDGTLVATSAEIDGTITAGIGSTIGGWYIGSDRIRSGNKDTIGPTGMGSGTTENSIAFWAGWTEGDLDKSQFYVTSGGTLVAEDATVTGTINASELNINGTNAAFTVSETGAITGLTFTSDKSKTAGFTFDSNGLLKLSTASFDSLGSNSSGIYLTPTTIKIGTTGTFELKSTNFEVTTTGTITAKDGTVGGWTIGTKQLHSGKDNAYYDAGTPVSTYVGLSSDEANEFAIWCGNSVAASAPFRVRRNGLVYLTKVVDLDDKGNEKVIDLGKYSLGKLQYRTVKSVSSDGTTVTLSDGTTFNTAASVTIKSGTWSGSGTSRSLAITLTPPERTTQISTIRWGWGVPGVSQKNIFAVWQITRGMTSETTLFALTINESHTFNETTRKYDITLTEGSTTILEKSTGTEAWKDGWVKSAGRVYFPTHNESSNEFVIKAPDLTGPDTGTGTDREATYHIFENFTSEDDYKVYVRGGATNIIIATLKPSVIFEKGLEIGGGRGRELGWVAAANRVEFPGKNESTGSFKFVGPQATYPETEPGRDREGQYTLYEKYTNDSDYKVYVKGGPNSETIATITPTTIFTQGVEKGKRESTITGGSWGTGNNFYAVINNSSTSINVCGIGSAWNYNNSGKNVLSVFGGSNIGPENLTVIITRTVSTASEFEEAERAYRVTVKDGTTEIYNALTDKSGWKDGWAKSAQRFVFPSSNEANNSFAVVGPDSTGPDTGTGTDRSGTYHIYETYTSDDDYKVYVKGGPSNNTIAVLKPSVIFNKGVDKGTKYGWETAAGLVTFPTSNESSNELVIIAPQSSYPTVEPGTNRRETYHIYETYTSEDDYRVYVRGGTGNNIVAVLKPSIIFGKGVEKGTTEGRKAGWEAAAARTVFPSKNESTSSFAFYGAQKTHPDTEPGRDQVGQYTLYEKFDSTSSYSVYVKGGPNSETIATIKPTSIFTGGVTEGKSQEKITGGSWNSSHNFIATKGDTTTTNVCGIGGAWNYNNAGKNVLSIYGGSNIGTENLTTILSYTVTTANEFDATERAYRVTVKNGTYEIYTGLTDKFGWKDGWTKSAERVSFPSKNESNNSFVFKGPDSTAPDTGLGTDRSGTYHIYETYTSEDDYKVYVRGGSPENTIAVLKPSIIFNKGVEKGTTEGREAGWVAAAGRLSFPVSNETTGSFKFAGPQATHPTTEPGRDQEGQYTLYEKFDNINSYRVYVKGGPNNETVAVIKPTSIFSGGVTEGKDQASLTGGSWNSSHNFVATRKDTTTVNVCGIGGAWNYNNTGKNVLSIYGGSNIGTENTSTIMLYTISPTATFESAERAYRVVVKSGNYEIYNALTDKSGWKDGWTTSAGRTSFPGSNESSNSFTFKAPDSAAPDAGVGTDRAGTYHIFETFTSKSDYKVYVKGGPSDSTIAVLKPSIIYNKGVEEGTATGRAAGWEAAARRLSFPVENTSGASFAFAGPQATHPDTEPGRDQTGQYTLYQKYTSASDYSVYAKGGPNNETIATIQPTNIFSGGVAVGKGQEKITGGSWNSSHNFIATRGDETTVNVCGVGGAWQYGNTAKNVLSIYGGSNIGDENTSTIMTYTVSTSATFEETNKAFRIKVTSGNHEIYNALTGTDAWDKGAAAKGIKGGSWGTGNNFSVKLNDNSTVNVCGIGGAWKYGDTAQNVLTIYGGSNIGDENTASILTYTITHSVSSTYNDKHEYTVTIKSGSTTVETFPVDADGLYRVGHYNGGTTAVKLNNVTTTETASITLYPGDKTKVQAVYTQLNGTEMVVDKKVIWVNSDGWTKGKFTPATVTTQGGECTVYVPDSVDGTTYYTAGSSVTTRGSKISNAYKEDSSGDQYYKLGENNAKYYTTTEHTGCLYPDSGDGSSWYYKATTSGINTTTLQILQSVAVELFYKSGKSAGKRYWYYSGSGKKYYRATDDSTLYKVSGGKQYKSATLYERSSTTVNTLLNASGKKFKAIDAWGSGSAVTTIGTTSIKVSSATRYEQGTETTNTYYTKEK